MTNKTWSTVAILDLKAKTTQNETIRTAVKFYNSNLVQNDSLNR